MLSNCLLFHTGKLCIQVILKEDTALDWELDLVYGFVFRFLWFFIWITSNKTLIGGWSNFPWILNFTCALNKILDPLKLVPAYFCSFCSWRLNNLKTENADFDKLWFGLFRMSFSLKTWLCVILTGHRDSSSSTSVFCCSGLHGDEAEAISSY